MQRPLGRSVLENSLRIVRPQIMVLGRDVGGQGKDLPGILGPRRAFAEELPYPDASRSCDTGHIEALTASYNAEINPKLSIQRRTSRMRGFSGPPSWAVRLPTIASNCDGLLPHQCAAPYAKTYGCMRFRVCCTRRECGRVMHTA